MLQQTKGANQQQRQKQQQQQWMQAAQQMHRMTKIPLYPYVHCGEEEAIGTTSSRSSQLGPLLLLLKGLSCS
jgi:hypothetical protein